jgi:hypothetical protein
MHQVPVANYRIQSPPGASPYCGLIHSAIPLE